MSDKQKATPQEQKLYVMGYNNGRREALDAVLGYLKEERSTAHGAGHDVFTYAIERIEQLRAEPQSERGEVCALGCLGKHRQIDMKDLDPYCYETLSGTFGVAEALIREVEYENDERYATDEQRYERMLKWVESQLLDHENQKSGDVEK